MARYLCNLCSKVVNYNEDEHPCFVNKTDYVAYLQPDLNEIGKRKRKNHKGKNTADFNFKMFPGMQQKYGDNSDQVNTSLAESTGQVPLMNPRKTKRILNSLFKNGSNKNRRRNLLLCSSSLTYDRSCEIRNESLLSLPKMHEPVCRTEGDNYNSSEGKSRSPVLCEQNERKYIESPFSQAASRERHHESNLHSVFTNRMCFAKTLQDAAKTESFESKSISDASNFHSNVPFSSRLLASAEEEVKAPGDFNNIASPHVPGYPPVCENHSISSITATEAVAGLPRIQNTLGEKINNEKELYYSTNGTNSAAGPTAGSMYLRRDPGKGKFSGDLCDKESNFKNQLDKHYQKHEEKKIFVCNVCERTFTYKRSFEKHYGTHPAEKPFNCDICQKHFKLEENLQRHNRIHTGEKPFQCVTCKKEFNRKDNLQRHNRIHTGEKPFQCVTCKKEFNQKEGLKKHKRIHTR